MARRSWHAAALAACLAAAGTSLVACTVDGTAVAEPQATTTVPTSAAASSTSRASTTAPSATTTRATTPTSSAAATPTVPEAALTEAPTPAELDQITRFSTAFVRAISDGDVAAMRTLLCGSLAEQHNRQVDQPATPTTFVRVSDVGLTTDRTSAAVTVWAYRVSKGPPAKPEKFVLTKSGDTWQACERKTR
ncbi:hypothetical protein [Rhodococcus sp. X156]|uniref:hypothetical protein n=1 Tax=Rhodococcus sp. X156 TaxID=2499145 RepID=UPI000FD9024E|nr:hypothetical protein [Rhodococcus sp. X156]